MGTGPRSVTLKDVAEAAGVSRATASNVFSKPQVVRPEVQARVREAARTLGYAGPSPQGRLLRAGRANAIGIAAAEPLEYFFADPWARTLLAEVARVCDARGAGLALVSVAGGRRPGWSIESALVDGFLLRCGGRDLIVEVTQRRGLPFVALSLDEAEPGVPAIDIDDFGAARAVARHLLDQGHRRFAVLAIGLGDRAGPSGWEAARATRFVNVRERARGYLAAFAEAGLPEAEVPLLAVRNDGANAAEALDALLAGPGPRPTALLAMSDLVAMAALEALEARGLRVPGDLSVAGFDGVPEGAGSRPPLTTVAQPYARLAERSVAAILDGAMPEGREVLPLELVVRGSTGPAPA